MMCCHYFDKLHFKVEKIVAYTKANPKRGFSVEVTEFVPNKQMTWIGGLPLGLFQGVRTFTLDPQEDDSVHFTLHEEFSGLLFPLFARSLPDLQVFKGFVAGLRAHAEGK